MYLSCPCFWQKFLLLSFHWGIDTDFAVCSWLSLFLNQWLRQRHWSREQSREAVASSENPSSWSGCCFSLSSCRSIESGLAVEEQHSLLPTTFLVKRGKKGSSFSCSVSVSWTKNQKQRRRTRGETGWGEGSKTRQPATHCETDCHGEQIFLLVEETSHCSRHSCIISTVFSSLWLLIPHQPIPLLPVCICLTIREGAGHRLRDSFSERRWGPWFTFILSWQDLLWIVF